MITFDQVRAARGLLDWSQKDLAQKSGVSLPALNNFERGAVIPRETTLNLIQQTFELHDIEFIGETGVQKQSELFSFKRLQGPHFADLITKDIVSCLRPPYELLAVGMSEEPFQKYSKNDDKLFAQHMQNHKIKHRTIISSDTRFLVLKPEHYRMLPPAMVGSIYWFTYVDRFCIVNWKKPAHALWVRNKSIAEVYQNQFDALWRSAYKIPDHVLMEISVKKSTP